MRHNDTRMVLNPDSEFFRYFVDPSGKPRDGAQSGRAPAAPVPAPASAPSPTAR
jgi:membrane protease subunit HflC